jgi:hypothetical protein
MICWVHGVIQVVGVGGVVDTLIWDLVEEFAKRSPVFDPKFHGNQPFPS